MATVTGKLQELEFIARQVVHLNILVTPSNSCLPLADIIVHRVYLRKDQLCSQFYANCHRTISINRLHGVGLVIGSLNDCID